MRRIEELIDILSDAGEYVAVFSVASLVLLVGASVLGRWALDAPVLIADELAGFLTLAAVFLGLAPTLRAGAHVRADFLLSRLPSHYRRIAERAFLVLGLAWSIVLVLGVWSLVAEYYAGETRSLGPGQFALWIPASLMVVGVTLFCLQFAACLLKSFRC